MRGMILAAGRGERMGALTARVPKPLLQVGGRALIEYSIDLLRNAGIHEIIVNVSYCADQIQKALGCGKQYDVSLTYSVEPTRLETGGGIVQALPFFQGEPFLVVSADIITDFPLEQLVLSSHQLAHLMMVPNPSFHLAGDFAIQDGLLQKDGVKTHTFGNVGLYHPDLFLGRSPACFPLRDVLLPAVQSAKIAATVYSGSWFNIGTPEQLLHLNSATMLQNF